MQLSYDQKNWFIKFYLFVFFIFILLLADPALAFKEWVHDDINDTAMENMTFKARDGSDLIFSLRAIKEVKHATRSVDYRNPRDGFRGELMDVTAHCDDEMLEECSERIEMLKFDLIDKADKMSGKQLRILLGRALHTVQDFYSHSNWVDERGMNKTTPNMNLGKNPLNLAQENEACCQPTEWDLYDGVGTVKLTSGYFPLKLRQGWWPLAWQWLNVWSPPANKCAHGYSGSPDNIPPVTICVGINKDFAGRPYFGRARSVAISATKLFINEIVDDLRKKYPDYKEIRKLLNVRGTLGFVIDDTGSMSPTLNGVKQAVTQIVNRVKDNLSVSPDEYLLVRFGDNVGSPYITEDPDEFLSRVNALSASGGGDCPESSNSAMLRAINAAQFGSRLWLFTDASAKDPGVTQNVIAAAKAKEITRLKYVLTGSCSRYAESVDMGIDQTSSERFYNSSSVRAATSVDPVYEEIVKQTGGQMTILENNESAVASYYSIIEPELTEDLEQLLIVSDTLSDAPMEYLLPVDSTMKSLGVYVNMAPKGSITLYRPNGLEVEPGDTDAAITEMSGGSFINVSAPVAGTWKLMISGDIDATYSLTVTANTSLRIERFEFVELKGLYAHEALYAIDGQPVIGTQITALANLGGPFSSARFILGTEDGYVKKEITLEQGYIYASEEDFVGEVELPEGPFRLYVIGTDNSGFGFMRAFPTVFVGQAVEVVPLLDESEFDMVAGKSSTACFNVTNRGSEEKTFAISATDDFGFDISVSDESVTLGADESAQVCVELETPEETPGDTNVVLTVVASATTESEMKNSAAFGWRVKAAEQTVGPASEGSGGGGGGGGCFINTMAF